MNDDKNNNKNDINEANSQPNPEKEIPIDATEPADDVTFENEDGEGNTQNLAAKLKQLREKLSKCEAERAEYLAGWQRAKADLINARKRDEEDKKDFVKYANENLIGELLLVLDSFNMAFSNPEAWEKVDKNWRMGVEYIYSQLIAILEQFNLKPINPKGQKFDPNIHIAIENMPVTDKALDDIIVEVVQKGYTLNGKVMRAPKVKVGEFKG